MKLLSSARSKYNSMQVSACASSKWPNAGIAETLLQYLHRSICMSVWPGLHCSKWKKEKENSDLLGKSLRCMLMSCAQFQSNVVLNPIGGHWGGGKAYRPQMTIQVCATLWSMVIRPYLV